MRSNAGKCKSVYGGASGAVPPPRPVQGGGVAPPPRTLELSHFSNLKLKSIKKFNLLFFMLVLFEGEIK